MVSLGELAGAEKNSFHCHEEIRIYDRATSAMTRLTRDCVPRDYGPHDYEPRDHACNMSRLRAKSLLCPSRLVSCQERQGLSSLAHDIFFPLQTRTSVSVDLLTASRIETVLLAM